MAVIGIYLLNGLLKKGSLNKIQVHASETFLTNVSAGNAFKAIRTFAAKNSYKIDDINEEQYALILNEPMTWKSYGFFYPIYVHGYASRTTVEVGITSKLGSLTLLNPYNKKIMATKCKRMLSAIKAEVSVIEKSEKRI